jgi:hypothetical protein
MSFPMAMGGSAVSRVALPLDPGRRIDVRQRIDDD